MMLAVLDAQYSRESVIELSSADAASVTWPLPQLPPSQRPRRENMYIAPRAEPHPAEQAGRGSVSPHISYAHN